MENLDNSKSWQHWFYLLATGQPEPKYRPRRNGLPLPPSKELTTEEKQRIINLINHKGNWPIGVDAINLK